MFGGINNVFNQPLDAWNTSSVTKMAAMFGNNDSFNQPLNTWNTSNVTDMSSMFA
jgi:surface protein